MGDNRENWIVSYPDDGNSVCFDMEDISFWYQHRNECLIEAMKANHFPKDFLDIGGGNGITALAMQNAGYDVTLVEPYLSGIENAKRRGIRSTIQSTLEDYVKQATGTAPAAGFFDVMEHIKNDRAFLENVNSLLVPNGQIMLTVPAFSSLWSENDVQLGHFRRYTLGQLTDLLTKTGFEVTYKTYFFSLVWVPMWFARVLPEKFGIKKNNTPEKKRNEHMVGRPGTARILRKLLSWEAKAIRSKSRIPFGTSCLIVARKTRDL
ncbi:class I SAM-dependent methyltransferase [Dyadobacter sp. CY261]|uniref:class I SAM-dependent methyltransferase n=1 Tax=Dyadobacter sp. CY261 TaxID=2907203 RepID=UPI001F3FB3C2|nr:class I SAM-dependent methyltransferase [Dyadobacter sp. CY261]MCF0071009.1 class I SAM-dependent methyltransferase [Dyadobacter sp. CY261]